MGMVCRLAQKAINEDYDYDYEEEEKDGHFPEDEHEAIRKNNRKKSFACKDSSITKTWNN